MIIFYNLQNVKSLFILCSYLYYIFVSERRYNQVKENIKDYNLKLGDYVVDMRSKYSFVAMENYSEK